MQQPAACVRHDIIMTREGRKSSPANRIFDTAPTSDVVVSFPPRPGDAPSKFARLRIYSKTRRTNDNNNTGMTCRLRGRTPSRFVEILRPFETRTGDTGPIKLFFGRVGKLKLKK